VLSNSPQFICRVWKKNTKNLGWSSRFSGRNWNPKYLGDRCPGDRDVLFAVRRKRAWHTHTTFILIKTTAFLRRALRQNQYSNKVTESGPQSIHTKWYSKSFNFDQNSIWSKHVYLQYQISPSPYIENTLRKHKMKTYKHRTHVTYLRLNHSLHPQGLLRKFQAVVIYIMYRDHLYKILGCRFYLSRNLKGQW